MRGIEHQLEKRFRAKVRVGGPEQCWPWIGAMSASGYGRFRIKSQWNQAHRIAWSLYRGELPTDLCVCHTCDNRRCVNPAHLFLGSQTDNIADRHVKGRSRGGSQPGERHPRHKATAADVAAIRASGLNSAQLAPLYPGLSRSTIRAIKNGTTWR